MSTPRTTQEKPTLLQLRLAHNAYHKANPKKQITAHQLADIAGVPFYVEYLLEIGGFGLLPEEAERIMAAYSQLTGSHYTLRDIKTHITPAFVPRRGTGNGPHKTHLL